MIEYHTQAIVLNKSTAGEQDGRVSIYSEELGKLEIAAKGLKKITSKFGHHLEPLNLIDCLVLSNRTKQLKGVAAKNYFWPVKKSESALAAASRCLHIFDSAVIEPEKDIFLWRKLSGFLAVLEKLAIDREEKEMSNESDLAAVYFLSKLGERLGLLPMDAVEEKRLSAIDKIALAELFSGRDFGKLNRSVFMNISFVNLENIIKNKILSYNPKY